MKILCLTLTILMFVIVTPALAEHLFQRQIDTESFNSFYKEKIEGKHSFDNKYGEWAYMQVYNLNDKALKKIVPNFTTKIAGQGYLVGRLLSYDTNISHIEVSSDGEDILYRDKGIIKGLVDCHIHPYRPGTR